MKTEVVSIIGVDKVTASIGLALKASNLGLSLFGFVKDKHEARQALDVGAVDETTGNLIKAVESADILIVKSSQEEHAALLEVIGQYIKDHALVIDLSSLKGAGLKLAELYIKEGHYVGAYPVLAAAWLEDGRQGIASANADLFEHSVFCVMPSAKADQKAVETTVNLGRILGATPYFLDPFEYDSLVQGVQTLPGLTAAALFRSLSQAAGWRDLLRFAGLDFALSTSALENPDIAALAMNDQDSVLRWLDAALAEMQVMRRAVADGDQERLALILDDTRLDRRGWIEERARNAWVGVGDENPDLSPMSIGAQLFGFRRPKKKD